jgi:iron complex transport system permease protein
MNEFDQWPMLRMLTAFIIGYLLSLMGSITQWLTENKLASPSTLGIDALGVGVVLIFLFFHSMNLVIPEELKFIIILMISVSLSFVLTRFARYSIGRRILFLGLAINLFMGAGFALVQFLSLAYGFEFPHSLWFGQIFTPSKKELIFLGISFTLILLTLMMNLKKLLSTGLGHGLVITLQKPIERIWRCAIFICLLGTLSIIWLFGVYSFMGLILPSLLRSLPGIKGRPKNELTFGAILGGVIFMILDLCCYFFPIMGAEIPVGLLSATLGAMALVILSSKEILSFK